VSSLRVAPPPPSWIIYTLSDLPGGTNRAFKAAGLTVGRTPTKEQNVTHRHTVAGALVLNIPMLVAAAYLPTAATATMAVCLAALGAALGMLAGWGFEPQRAARGAESAVSAERPRYAEAA
jgi:IMP dehydrogenase/GMP reductase